MNFRKLPLIDKLGLMTGSEVPVRKQKYFLQVETITNNGLRYARSWSPLDEVRQKDLTGLEEENLVIGYRKTVQKTGNENILKLIQLRTIFFIEREEVEEE